MKCLSDKYLGPKQPKKSKQRKVVYIAKKGQKLKKYKVKSEDSDDDSSSGLGYGRINETINN